MVRNHGHLCLSSFKRDREKTEAWATLDKYAGRYDGTKWQREELYDRAGLR